MEPTYGATDDGANTPLMEQSPLLTDKPRRGRAAVAAVIGTTLMAATATTTQRYADLRASLRTPRGTPSVDWVYDLTVRSRRPAVSQRFHAVDATRIHERRRWVVSFSILRPFGPNRVSAMLRAGDAGPVLAAHLRPEHAGDAALRAVRVDDVLGTGRVPRRGGV